MRLLRLNDKSDVVVTLQAALRDLGLYKGSVDGYFGYGTQAAVKLFQAGFGLLPDGIVGANTWKALNEETGIISGKVLYLMLHATATQEGKEYGPEWIDWVHRGPRELPNGQVIYKAKRYKNIDQMPREKLEGGVWNYNVRGRGWTKKGYRVYIDLAGKAHKISPDNGNDTIESFEVNYGALGFNYNCIHICYCGGLDLNNNVKDTRTDTQKKTMEEVVKAYIKKHPWIKVLGHNQVAAKGCPCFDVPKWLRSIGVKEENIF